jgi:hypothetical protein
MVIALLQAPCETVLNVSVRILIDQEKELYNRNKKKQTS